MQYQSAGVLDLGLPKKRCILRSKKYKNTRFAGQKSMTKNKSESPDILPTHDHSAEHALRIEKVEKMRALGIEPWPEFKHVNATAKQVLDEFKDETESPEFHIAGRIVTLRPHGKTAFFHIQDRSGKIQIYLREDVIGADAFAQFQQFVDIGDIVWIAGKSFRTKMGEVSVKADQVVLLSKCLHPLPDKFHGLTHIETIYRQRYLDLITNPDSRERFRRRFIVIRTMRAFLDEHGFMEVETPMLHPIPGGAAAKPFVTHHNALDSELYLRIAPELYLKRLAIGGFERVYEINRNFRNEGISTRHNPEFTMLEFYMAHENYVFSMNFVEQMLQRVVQAACGQLVVPYGQHMIDFEKSFKRVSLTDSVIEFGGIKADELHESTIDATLARHKVVPANKKASLGEKIYALFEELVEHQLIQPTFIFDFPIEVSPLAKRDKNNPNVASRYELFIAGMEISNSFNELNDPFDQSERFKAQAHARASGDVEAHHYDADYIEALEYGLPPMVGVGIGIDRLAMLVSDAPSIKEVILFPTLKKK